MPAKLVRKELIEITYQEVTRLVKENYSFMQDYNFPLLQECGNDTQHTFDVSGVLDSDDCELWDRVATTRDSYHLLYRNDLVLNKLCQDDLLPRGEYLVKVSW